MKRRQPRPLRWLSERGCGCSRRGRYVLVGSQGGRANRFPLIMPRIFEGFRCLRPRRDRWGSQKAVLAASIAPAVVVVAAGVIGKMAFTELCLVPESPSFPYQGKVSHWRNWPERRETLRWSRPAATPAGGASQIENGLTWIYPPPLGYRWWGSSWLPHHLPA